VEKNILNAQNPSLRIERHFGVVDLRALVGGGEEVLRAVLDPLHRPAELDRHPGNQHLLGVEHHDLRAEAAADEGRDDPHLALREPEHRREAVADHHWRLRGVPDGEAIGFLVPLRHYAACFDGRRSPPVVEEAAPQDKMCALRGLRIVAARLAHVRRHIARDVVVHARRIGRESVLEVYHGRKRLVVDRDRGRRVFREITALGDDERHRLARVAHLVLGERHLRALVEERALDRRRRHQQWPGLPVVAEVLRGIHGEHAFVLARPRYVDAADARMRVRAAHECGVQHSRKLDVVDEKRAARKEARVFIPGNRGAEVPGGHLERERTASTMCW
jgi:hypothetical protein